SSLPPLPPAWQRRRPTGVVRWAYRFAVCSDYGASTSFTLMRSDPALMPSTGWFSLEPASHEDLRAEVPVVGRGGRERLVRGEVGVAEEGDLGAVAADPGGAVGEGFGAGDVGVVRLQDAARVERGDGDLGGVEQRRVGHRRDAAAAPDVD